MEEWNGIRDLYNRRPKTKRNQTDYRTAVIERMYLRVLGELCMGRFEWKGFESTGVNVRYLELNLYFMALCVVFRDEPVIGPGGVVVRHGTNQIFGLRGAPSGGYNLVQDPIAFTVTGPNYVGRTVSALKAVPVWANAFRYPDNDIVQIYANRLAEIDRTIEINTRNARRNKVLTYNENSTLTAKNINDMIDRGEATIPVNFAIGDMVAALDLGVDPKSIEALSILRSRLWNEAMGLLGINNANQDKKERLVEAEVGANDDQVNSARRVNLNARQKAAEEISEMFDLNVTVDYYANQPAETVNPITVEGTGASA